MQVYKELKTVNRKIKKELTESQSQNESLRSIFAEFQVEFRQNKKEQKLFGELTINDL